MLSKRRLEANIVFHKARHTYRRARVKHWREQGAPAKVEKWEKLAAEAAEMLALRRKQLAALLAPKAPRIVGHSVSGLRPGNVFGSLGPEHKVTTHYAASARARNLTEGLALARQFDAFHRGKGWGGVSYHYLIPDSGELILGRSTSHKGAHVLNTNSNNIGVNFFCTAGDHPTKAQAETFMWLLANAHTDLLPSSHRTDLDLRRADTRGHNAWPGQSTGCPGNFTPSNLKRIAST